MTARTTPAHGAPAQHDDPHTWTGRIRRWMLAKLPPDKLLPEDQPSYVMSWAYVFGMGAVASLLWIIMSGVVLGLNGPSGIISPPSAASSTAPTCGASSSSSCLWWCICG